jgi:hypothetical protein
MVIVSLDMVQRDTDLQNALVHPPDWPEFFAPKIFERFMLFEVFATIELSDTSAQCRRGRFVTRREHPRIIEAEKRRRR